MSTHPSTVIQFAFCLCLNLSVTSCRYNPFCGAALVSPWLCQYLCILHLPIVLPTFAHPIVHTQLCASYKAILRTGDTVLPGVRHLTPAGRLPGSGARWPQIGSACLPASLPDTSSTPQSLPSSPVRTQSSPPSSPCNSSLDQKYQLTIIPIQQ